MPRYMADTAFPLSHGKKRPRATHPDHLKFIRDLPCLICRGGMGRSQAAHLRFGLMAVGKPNTGAGIKPDDCWTVPLCETHHLEQHHYGNEPGFWEFHGIDCIKVAALLYLHFSHQDHKAAEMVCMKARDL